MALASAGPKGVAVLIEKCFEQMDDRGQLARAQAVEQPVSVLFISGHALRDRITSQEGWDRKLGRAGAAASAKVASKG